jgi:aminoglycoside phosphotransferase (APT) family kinase protein
MSDLAVDLERLAGWMDGQGLGSDPIENSERLAGGSQNILLRFSRSGRDYVLRRPPEHVRANSNETMRREARLLGAIAASAVPHPRLIAACPDEDVLGASFYLMEPIEGFNPQNGLPESHHDAAIQHRMGLAVIEGLVALHGLDHAALGLADFGKTEGFLERQVARWRSQLDGYGELAGWPGEAELGDVGAVANWLEANRPASFTPGILHGDFHLANVMVRNDSPELAAIIDWELATIGDPLIDLGWLLATWPQVADGGMLDIKPWHGFPTPGELVAHYAAHASRSVKMIDWYGVFGCYKLGILLEGTHARACAGKASKDVGDRLHARARWLFARARRWMAHGVLSGES